MGADSDVKTGTVVPRRSDAEWADPRDELDDIKAQGIRGSELVDEATARLARFTRAGRWRELLTEDYATVAEFLAAEFPMLAQLAIPVSPRRELVALMAAEQATQKVIATALGVSQATVSGDLGIINFDNSGPSSQVSEPGKRGRGRPRGKHEDPHADLRGELDRGKPGKPPEQVQEAVTTATAETAAEPVAEPVAVAEAKPHVCVYDRYVCACGREDTAFIASYEALEAQAEQKYRQRVTELEADRDQWKKMALDLSAGPDGAQREHPHGEPGRAPRTELEAVDAAYEGSQDPSAGVFAFLDEEPDYEGSQVPGGRRRG